jgi:hypothetical protein
MAIRANKPPATGNSPRATAQMIDALRDKIATWRPDIRTDPRPKKANGSPVRRRADIEASAMFLLRSLEF